MKNPLLSVQTPDGESKLKDFIVEYVGTKFDEENVTVQMISEVLAAEFPEFLFAFAEENFIRGYETGFDDGTKMFENGGNNDACTEWFLHTHWDSCLF